MTATIIIPLLQDVDIGTTIDHIVSSDLFRVCEIIVIDARNEITIPVNLKHNNIKYVRCKGFTLAAIRDISLQHAHGELLIFVNQSVTIYGVKWIQTLLDEYTDNAIMCTGYRNTNTNKTYSGAGLSVYKNTFLDKQLITKKAHSSIDVPVATGPVLVVSKSWLKTICFRVRMVDHKYFEDQVLSYRSWRYGGSCRVNNNIVVIVNEQPVYPHPYDFYLAKFNAIRLIGLDESFIESCAETLPISHRVYVKHMTNTQPKDRQEVNPIAHEETMLRLAKLNDLFKLKFDPRCGDKQLPKITNRVMNFGRAVHAIAKGLLKDPKNLLVADEVREERIKLCQWCPNNDCNGHCTVCGCSLYSKLPFQEMHCPLKPPIW